MSFKKISVFLYSLSFVRASPAGMIERTITPDNTCGATSAGKYTCNPADPYGGACCSSSEGWCGNTAAYCGTGCQSAYGSCGPYGAVTKNGNLWTVAGVGSFAYAETFTFTGSSLPARLSSSAYDVQADSAPCGHTFTSANVIVSGGALQLKVPGGQTCSSSSKLSSAEVITDFINIKYASVRTTAMISSAAGTCNGFFFYKNDSQEMDIEYLSDPTSLSNPGDGSKPMQYTNQAISADVAATYGTGPSPSDATTAYHEYRIDWIPGKTIYYLDGAVQKTYTTNVPTQPGRWIWNNWGNGDQGWTGAPPKTDSVLKIQQITMYYNISTT